MATKSSGKWLIRVDYTDLNRACPKDSFPLPKIDQLIDSTARNKLLRFMDTFSRYPSDQDKTRPASLQSKTSTAIRSTIKAQALADFVVEFSVNPDLVTKLDPSLNQTDLNWPEDNKTWILYKDGSSSQSGCKARTVVTDPKGVECNHCFKFEFRATNNEAKYEALLARMGVAEALGAEFLLVKSDSQLVINQVLGLYQAKGDNMVAYLVKVREVMSGFKGGLDLIGPLPTTPSQAKHVVVEIDYFTRWVETKALVKITEEKTTSFVKESIVCRFGTPMDIITDLGKQFDNAKFREFCEDRNIGLQFALMAHPQTNGLVEATNKTVKKLLKKKLQQKKGLWVEELLNVLWRTTGRTTTGETSYSLVFGTKAVLPIEQKLISFRIQNYEPEDNKAKL
ncbi:hypothetical protein LWI28_024585 [Acer negundo]|uniref:Integrase catalytic domain-containing protein n=1 Tax=Acer negundo TaxID=4023 RepID=A0AAD5JRD1_ACENE|nr:hypothetical protein LWI28_024585 [Acer negundo]